MFSCVATDGISWGKTIGVANTASGDSNASKQIAFILGGRNELSTVRFGLPKDQDTKGGIFLRKNIEDKKKE